MEGSKKAVKVQSLLTYREAALSEKTEAFFSGKPKFWDLLFMGTSTLTSEHRPKLKLASCLDTRLCSRPWVSSISGGGGDFVLAQLFNITQMVSYHALQMSLCLLPNPPFQIS